MENFKVIDLRDIQLEHLVKRMNITPEELNNRRQHVYDIVDAHLQKAMENAHSAVEALDFPQGEMFYLPTLAISMTGYGLAALYVSLEKLPPPLRADVIASFVSRLHSELPGLEVTIKEKP